MKRKLCVLFAVFFLLCAMSVPAYAREVDSMVIDSAGLLTEEQQKELNARAWSITEAYQCDTLIITIPELYGMEPWECAEALVQEYDLGYGKENSLIMLLMATADRDYDIMANGYGQTAFTDWGMQELEERILPYFSEDDYYEGYVAYLDTCEEFLIMARDGRPFDSGTDPEQRLMLTLVGAVAGLLLPALAAFLVCWNYKNQMKTARKQEMAHAYIAPKGLTLTAREDRFLHVTHTRQKIERKSSGSSRSSGGSRGGSSHRSGKY